MTFEVFGSKVVNGFERRVYLLSNKQTISIPINPWDGWRAENESNSEVGICEQHQVPSAGDRAGFESTPVRNQTLDCGICSDLHSIGEGNQVRAGAGLSDTGFWVGLGVGLLAGTLIVAAASIIAAGGIK